MSEVEVHISLGGRTRTVSTLYQESIRHRESVAFRYAPAWLENSAAFALEPTLRLDRGTHHTGSGQPWFGALSDSVPDSWGRRLMQRNQFRQAKRQGRTPRSLAEVDCRLGVSDAARQGALRFKRSLDGDFQSPGDSGVPPLVRLSRLLAAADRVDRGEEDDEDMAALFAPGSSLGGARSKASGTGPDGLLSIAKFPKSTDRYSLDTWERVALVLARRAGVRTTHHELRRIK